ncbi:hypothetical protein [Tenuifilum osseticum]|uniref:hypothetical protein n=1 Tax=Tenuifilum TaxID=2760873 RepID=UPI0030A7A901
MLPFSVMGLSDGYLLTSPGRKPIYAATRHDLNFYIKTSLKRGRRCTLYAIHNGMLYEIPF